MPDSGVPGSQSFLTRLGRLGQGRYEKMVSIRTLVLEYMDSNGAAHIR